MTPDNAKSAGFTFSFRQLLMFMCLILLAVSIGSVSYMHTRQRSEMMEREIESSRESLETYIKDIEISISELEIFFIEIFNEELSVNTVSHRTDSAALFQEKTKILNLLGRTLKLNGSAQGAFFIAPGSSEPFFLARYLNNTVSVNDARKIRSDILSLADRTDISMIMGSWHSCMLNDSPCIIWMTQNADMISGIWISCSDYLKNCSRFLSTDSLSTLSMTENGVILSQMGPATEPEAGSALSGDRADRVNIEVPSGKLGTSVILSLSADSMPGKKQMSFDYVWYASSILLVIFIIVLAFQLFMYHPLLRLSGEVHALNDDNSRIHEDYRLREFAVLSRYINQTVCQLRMMKIRSYEAQLSEQQMTQEFLLMRHKTHFFINCISVIHALAREHKDELVSEMAFSLTDYLRKIDYEKQEFVTLNDELALIHSYIHIQKIRFGDSFRFIEDVPIDLFEALIPPLILQTFVENAVEHARIHEKDNLVSLKVCFSSMQGQDHLVIDIVDNGSGFPEEYRRELENPQQARHLSQGHGVGISNAIARLNHIYQGRAFVSISNEPSGGAHIQMLLPIMD